MIDLYKHSIPVEKPKAKGLAEYSSDAFRTMPQPKRVKEDGKEKVQPKEEEVVEVKDFLDADDLTVAELKEVLDSNGVEYTATKKADLVELVKGL